MLPGRDIAQDYLIRDSLPKTTAGKIDFNSVQEDENQKRRVLIKNN